MKRFCGVGESARACVYSSLILDLAWLSVRSPFSQIALLLLTSLICLPALTAQPSSLCTIDLPAPPAAAQNIFNDAQEQALGDALAEMFESRIRLAPESDSAFITHIGEQLLATLPPTGIHYRFRIYESGEVNGFSLAGGRVYISRKLIAAVKNEDELSAVLAHEIGHLYTHQTAIKMSNGFRVRLGVTQVTDRADVFARVHQFFNTPPQKSEIRDSEEKDQLIADRVSLIALARAGYAVESLPNFLNASMVNNGQTGTWFSDLFGITHEASKRYRSSLKLVGELPATCSNRKPTEDAAFQRWRDKLLENRLKTAASGNVEDHPMKLADPLQPALVNLHISPDGALILAQDEGGIFILDAASGKTLFHIDAPDVEPAQFTPDSKYIVFHDARLRVEKWEIAGARKIFSKELVIYEGCSHTILAPDGRTLACVTVTILRGVLRAGLHLIDTESGMAFLDLPKFYQPFRDRAFSKRIFEDSRMGISPVHLSISRDSRYLIAADIDHAWAYDLVNRKAVQLGGKLKEMRPDRVSFLGSNQLIATDMMTNGKGLYTAHIYSFPAGEPRGEFEIGPGIIQPAANGNLIILRPIKGYAAGVLDPAQNKFVTAWKLPTIDVWGTRVVAEDTAGGLDIAVLGQEGMRRVSLALGPLPKLSSVAFSPDGKYLAVSLDSGSELWDLSTGKQIRAMRPFRSGWMDDTDTFYAQFQKNFDADPIALRFELQSRELTPLPKFGDSELQYHNLEYSIKTVAEKTGTPSHATMEFRDMEAKKLAWSRNFVHGTPVCWAAEDGRLVLAWDLGAEGASDEINMNDQLKQQLEKLKDRTKGLLLEIVNTANGATYQQVILPEADLTSGWSDERWATISGDLALVHGEHNNTTIYRISDAAKIGEFFGQEIATDAGADVVAAVNREDEIILFNEHSGQELLRFSLGSPVRAARIVNDRGKELLVLTADQVVHRIPLPQGAARINSEAGH